MKTFFLVSLLALPASFSRADGEMHEHVYAIVRWGYALVFVAGSPNPTGLGKAEAVLAKAVYTPAP